MGDESAGGRYHSRFASDRGGEGSSRHHRRGGRRCGSFAAHPLTRGELIGGGEKKSGLVGEEKKAWNKH